MAGETNLGKLLKGMRPKLNEGDYVFCSVADLPEINFNDLVFTFREEEGITLVVRKELADHLKLTYSFVAAWITLTVHSALEAVGLTAAFSTALAKEGIGCNVVAAFYHDHIFVDKKDATKALSILNKLSE